MKGKKRRKGVFKKDIYPLLSLSGFKACGAVIKSDGFLLKGNHCTEELTGVGAR